MRIVAFTTELDISRGGKQRSMLDVCQGLSKRGHLIDLLFLNDGPLHQNYIQFCRQCLQIDGYDVSKYQLIRSTVRFWNSFQSVAQKLSSVETESIDTIIYIDDHRLVFFAYWLGWKYRWPIVFHIRQPAIKSMPIKYRWPIKRLQKFISVSEEIKKEWGKENIPVEKISVIHNGIDTDYFVPGNCLPLNKKSKELLDYRVVTYLGRIDPQKGLETFIRSISCLLSRTPNLLLRVFIVGRPVLHSSDVAGAKYLQSLQTLVTNLSLETVVVFKPFVKQPLSLYHSSDLTVLPSIYPEPFGRTLIESMACGTPAIGSRIGGIPEILTGEFQAGLFEPGNEQELASRLDRWLNWRKFDPDLGRRCRQHIMQNFVLSKTIDQIESVLLSEVNK
ncbi:hypothetical protein C7271_03910 [filamentous cyanobacterium CCP5]|nr:hypothetical protein C7271_03910 [filamentous cyanobacterium CCP5]